MKLQEAYELVLPMRESTINIEKETVANKGKFGHALEKFLELNLGSHHLDFVLFVMVKSRKILKFARNGTNSIF
jgi:hypothetical protein